MIGAPLKYLDPKDVTYAFQKEIDSDFPRAGYSKKIPTSWMLVVGNVARRVYVMQYSNAGSAYVRIKGERVFLGSFDPRLFAQQKEKEDGKD